MDKTTSDRLAKLAPRIQQFLDLHPDEQAWLYLLLGRAERRAIAYSMDLLIPGLYVWLPGLNIRIGGSIPDDLPYKYPGKIHNLTGIALVFRSKLFSTYQGSFDVLP